MSQNVLIQNEQVVGGGVSSASQISYDNSGTSLPNNVQGAISSLNSNLTNSFKILEMGESAQFQFTTSVSEVNITVTFPTHNNCKVFAMLCGGGGYVGASFKLTSQTNSSATFKVYTTQVVPATYTFTITYIVVGV